MENLVIYQITTYFYSGYSDIIKHLLVQILTYVLPTHSKTSK